MRNADKYCKQCGVDFIIRSSDGKFVPDCLCEFSNRLRLRGRMGEMGARMIKLHLGCGTRTLDGWLGMDSRESVEPDIVGDVRCLDTWAGGDVGIIYACHVLEHIPRPDLLPTLREWRRVLRPGGTLRLSVPDFGTVVKLYGEGVSFWRLVGLLYGRQDYDGNTHYIGFDYEYLAWLLTEAGFYDIRKWSPFAKHPPGYDDYSMAKINGRLVSLNVEATA